MEGGHTQSQLREIPDVETLRELIDRLNEVENWNPVSRSDKITVEDVAEALHLDPGYVERELEAIYEAHREARLSKAMRELEEPLYSVERAGHAPHDPLGNPLYKLRSVQILAERNKTNPVLPRRVTKQDSGERVSKIIGQAMLYLVLALMLVLLGKIVMMALLTR